MNIRRMRGGRSVRIGLLIAQEGAAGLWGPSAQASAELAVHELNRDDGLLGAPVDFVVINAGSTWRSATDAVHMAIQDDGVNAIVGMLPSYARSPVAFAINERVPFIYTPQYEGFEGDDRIVTTGETSAELLVPALSWLSEVKKARRYFLCGSDYIWPRSTCAVARTIIQRLGGHVVGEMIAPLDHPDFSDVIDAIRRQQPDVVVPYFLGLDQVRFNRAFAEAGLHHTTLRYSSAIDETIIYGMGEDATDNLYTSSAYYAAIESDNNSAFLEGYHTLHGETPPPANSFGQSCYEGVHCLASLVEAAGGAHPRQLRPVVGRARQQRTARGAHVAGGRQAIYLAQLKGYDFSILSQSKPC
jgi:ABC-type branched-subunit amino acid transport system substrate-binding protein